MLFAGMLDLAIVCLLAPALAEYAGIKEISKKGFSLIAGAGVLFILAQGFSLDVFAEAFNMGFMSMGSQLFQVIGWLFLLIGAILAAYRFAMEEEM